MVLPVEVIDQAHGKDWTLYNGDSVEVIKAIPDNSVGLSCFSPPFADLFSYSASLRDMGNSRSSKDFAQHFQYLVAELYRVMMPGRIVAVHCMNLTATKTRDGYIGLKDFRGSMIRAFINDDVVEFLAAIERLHRRQFEAHQSDDSKRAKKLQTMIEGMLSEIEGYESPSGFIFHSEVCIWKDPLVAATRTHSIGLAHNQLVKDSAISRMGLPDYVVAFRKPGQNPEPVAHPDGLKNFIGENPPSGVYHSDPSKNKESHLIWQRYASPVWSDVRQTYTLQSILGQSAVFAAREPEDVRHVCPLQLDVITRCVELWSNPGDVVFSPFVGIGSELFGALQHGRKAIGIELKPSYFQSAKKTLAAYEEHLQSSLFAIA